MVDTSLQAILQAHGITASPRQLAEYLVESVESMEEGALVPATRELPEAELEMLRSGGFDVDAGPSPRDDPIARASAAFSALMETALTNQPPRLVARGARPQAGGQSRARHLSPCRRFPNPPPPGALADIAHQLRRQTAGAGLVTRVLRRLPADSGPLLRLLHAPGQSESGPLRAGSGGHSGAAVVPSRAFRSGFASNAAQCCREPQLLAAVSRGQRLHALDCRL